MNSSYLILMTHPDHPERVRVSMGQQIPSDGAQEDGSLVHYVARFSDGDAARMHLHEALHSCLIDAEHGLYRCTLAEAMAAAESESLTHERVMIDHELKEDLLEQVAQLSERRRARAHRVDKLWRLVGGSAIAILVLLLVLVGL